MVWKFFKLFDILLPAIERWPMCCHDISQKFPQTWAEMKVAYQEVFDPGVLPLVALMEVGFTLGQLVVVMGERKVNAARVDVHLVTKLVGCHYGALNMPTWTT